MTDSVVHRVLKSFLVKKGKNWDDGKAQRIIGKRPYEAAAIILEDC